MNQFKLNFYWRRTKTAIRRTLLLLGIGCTATRDVETIETLRGTWVRATGTRLWREMPHWSGNL